VAAHDTGHELVGRLLSGEAVASWAYTEPPPGDRLGELSLTITADGDDVVVRGVKRPVESAAESTSLLVTGRTGDGLTQVLVPVDAAGVSVSPMQSVDLTRRFSIVRFDDVRVPGSAVVGDVGGAADAVERQLLQAFVVLSTEAVGAMQRAFDLTLEWAFDRYSFGRPLASYQELKHRFADMRAWLEAGHAITDAAAEAVADGQADASKLASSAVAFVGEYGAELMQDCVQLHGGIGLTYEHDLHLFLRRHTIDRSLFGTPADHRQRVAAIVERATRAA
jgi:alkylation response protein AidB-like acyl-CoA dehydrogenase